MSDQDVPPMEQVVDAVSSWPGISTGEGRFGSTTFEVAGREIGHVHRSGPVDIGYPKPIWEQLISEGLTGRHHVIPASNATTYYLESADDVDRALTLLRISYLYHLSVLPQTATNEEVTENIDVDAELEELSVSEELRVAFEQTTHAG